MRHVRGLVVVTALLGLVVALLPAAASADAHADPIRPADVAAAVKADRDGDKVFDDLEAVLEPLTPQDDVAVIVTLTAPATKSRVDRVRAEEGDFDEGHRYSIVPAFSATMAKSQVLKAARRPDVLHVEHDSEVRATNESAQSSFGVTAAQAQVTGLTGAGLAAAVIDSGIDPNHPDLTGRVVAFKDYVDPGRTTAYDDHGHGTHVAGTIAANAASPNSGVAPAANLVGVKILNSAGTGSAANMIAAVDWVVANASTYNIVTINLSLGADGCSDGTDAASLAVNNAAAAGIVVAVAAGNAGSGTCTIGSPAAATGALTVGAMADFEQGGFHQAYFSSRGPTLDGRTKPDVSAPGVNITSAQANTLGYTTTSGTSMATPFVAGLALLMRQAGAPPADVKTNIMTTARDWGTAGTDKDYGAGRLDAYAALAAAGAALTLPPAIPAHDVKTGTLSGTGDVDDYPLVITDTSFPVAATLIHSSVSGPSSASPDFDLYLIAPNGSELDRGWTTRRQEDVGFKPTTTGTYTVRVESFDGNGPYLLDLSAGSSPATIPGAPSAVSATPGNGQASVSWTPPVDTGGAAITGYTVTPYIGGAAQSPRSFASTATTQSLTGLVNGTAYGFTVAATNAAGTGSDSPASSAVTPRTIPGAPSAVSATPGNGQADVSWTPPADNGGAAITGYTVTPYIGAAAQSPRSFASAATTQSLTGLANGTAYAFTVTATNAAGNGAESAASSAVTPSAPPPPRSGYWMLGSTGSVYGFGDAAYLGGPGGTGVTNIASMPSGNGYWVVSRSGLVSAYGDAPYLGGSPGLQAGEFVSSISATPNGSGYWLFTNLGRALPYGSARFFGDMSGVRLNASVLGSVATPSGNGYYMVASDGGIFTFGDAVFHGSMGGAHLNGAVVGLAPDPDGAGYWLVADDGGIFAFDAGFRGSMGGAHLNRPVVAMVAYGDGYLMVGSDGGIFNFSSKPFRGSLGSNPPTNPIVAVAPLTR